MNYKGETCAACGIAFTEDDDIVVCPECGSPHHRDCYKLTNTCANAELHKKNEKWKRSSAEPEVKPEIVLPPPETAYGGSERADNGAAGGMANGQGMQQGGMPNQGMNGDPGMVLPFLGFDPEDDMGGASLREVTQFVGTNTLYYIPIFKRMKDFGSKVSFNISCLIFPPLYFANRKMWGWAIITAIFTVILSLPSMLMMLPDYLDGVEAYEAALSLIYEHQSVIETLSSYFGIASWVMSIILCMFGNWFYYRFTLSSLRRIKNVAKDNELTSMRIKTEGGIKPANILIIIMIMSVMSLTLLYLAFEAMK